MVGGHFEHGVSADGLVDSVHSDQLGAHHHRCVLCADLDLCSEAV